MIGDHPLPWQVVSHQSVAPLGPARAPPKDEMPMQHPSGTFIAQEPELPAIDVRGMMMAPGPVPSLLPGGPTAGPLRDRRHSWLQVAQSPPM
jgi:hypothetical protein